MLPPEQPPAIDDIFDFRASARGRCLGNELIRRVRLIWDALGVFFIGAERIISA